MASGEHEVGGDECAGAESDPPALPGDDGDDRRMVGVILAAHDALADVLDCFAFRRLFTGA